MDVVSLCPLRAWGFVWQSQDGRFAQTVVVKATFTLSPGQAILAPTQEEPNEADQYWNDDATRSVVTPSDKAPYKPRADVMLVGQAYAPNKQPARSVIARLIVGDLDKSVEVWCDRGFRIHDGQLLEGARFTTMRLGWERAAGGPDTNNPAGMRFDAAPDAYGMVPIPNLQPPGIFVSQRSDTFAPACFGPVAPSWPQRAQRLGRLAGTFSQTGWEEQPLPEYFDPAFFQAAPPDQQVAEIRPNEQIVLENLHPEHARLVTRLPNMKPRAVAERATGEREDVTLMADTLWIDTDHNVCVVVWRGRIGLRHAQEAGRIAVTLEDVAPVKQRVIARTMSPEELLRKNAETAGESGAKRVMPFVGSDKPPSGRASASRPGDAGGLPFMRAEPPASTPGEPPASSPTSPASWLKDRTTAPPAQPPSAVPSASPWAMTPPPPAAVPPAPVAPPAPVVSPAPVAPPAPRSAPQPPSSPWASGASTGAAALAPAAPPASSGRPGSAAAASDAASDAQARTPAPAPQPPARPLATAPAGDRAQRPSEVLDLLWYDDAFVPRIRAFWEELVTALDFEPSDPRRDLGAEDPDKARSRHNVFGILSDGDMVDPTSISRVVAEAVNQKGRFTPPLTLTGGELRFPFDEVETLKATIVAMTPFLGADKRLKETVDSMSELLATPYLQGSTGVVEKLTRDLRTQFRDANRSLPPTYLDGHVERLLLEQRRYAIRKVFGGEFIRALLGAPGVEGGAIPVYLPKQLDQSLPMLVVMKVRIIAEAHLQQDPYDTSPYALRAVALGRSYQLDALRGAGRGGASA
ncbi:DUF2169 family type VI secretion system accessory protein [Polyangium aurulentum]|uniref:DUF2169 family type VI secretion system accessory protein n=1 Tax=Polyangium aurulentum TaxID=2567896 RepID=UPI00146F176E|nr:DUF2169 domain-containing protein [Polyangium aurulentum]UQA56366.1 DUF2169 domain-containing protein [Polyangium aurulentum]